MPIRKYNPDRHPIDIYLLARSGETDFVIAATLGISGPMLTQWRRKHPAVEYAISKARSVVEANGDTVTENFKGWVYRQLPADLQAHWRYINWWCDATNGRERIEAFLRPFGTEVRQSLWLHAMVCTNFNAPEACRLVCVNRKVVRDWTQRDPKFAELVDGLIWCKKQFFESALIGLVAEGNVMATIFANRTLNRDMGYGEQLELTTTVKHEHEFSIDLLDLPTEVKRQLLDAMRRYKEKQLAPGDNNVIDLPARQLPAEDE